MYRNIVFPQEHRVEDGAERSHKIEVLQFVVLAMAVMCEWR